MSPRGCVSALVAAAVMLSFYLLIAALIWDRASSVTQIP